MKILKWVFRIGTPIMGFFITRKAYLEHDCWGMAFVASILVIMTAWVVTDKRNIS